MRLKNRLAALEKENEPRLHGKALLLHLWGKLLDKDQELRAMVQKRREEEAKLPQGQREAAEKRRGREQAWQNIGVNHGNN